MAILYPMYLQHLLFGILLKEKLPLLPYMFFNLFKPLDVNLIYGLKFSTIILHFATQIVQIVPALVTGNTLTLTFVGECPYLLAL